MTLFGEDPSESPRLPSPWLSRSSGGTPSPLSLPTPDDSTPTTPTDCTSGTTFTRRLSSIDGFDLLDGFANEFDTTLNLRDKGGGTAFFPPRQAPTLEEITVVESRTGGLQPEVDHKGHIEYKLKLLTPTSLHRLEKLRTQLKWRLVEGGGTAVYELGILDNGTLVGLNESDMAESLRTLGQMLAGLGGGAVQVTRVVRLGGSGSTRRTPSPPGTAESPCNALFPSFDVPFDTDDIAFVTSVAPPQIDAQTGTVSIFPPERVRGPTPFPSNRTPDEQAELRRAKREARRLRKEAEVEAALRAGVPLHQHQHSHSQQQQQQRSFQTAYPTRIPPRDKPNKPPKPPRRHRVDNPSRRARNTSLGGDGEDGDRLDARPHIAPRAQPRPAAPPAPKSPPAPVDQSQYKPALLQDGDAEVRYVVEAVVRKAELAPPSPPLDGLHGAGRARRKSSASRPRRTEKDDLELALDVLAAGEEGAEQEGSVCESGEDEDEETSETSPAEGDEGWSFLEFDLERLSTSVKAAAAAAAASAAAAATTSTGPP
ncbi:hypothetical protein Rhopal_001603-T1 [Rhodotorula paludigena]|uniref:Uncharacterized protein n=1 Tax=Rhodotorula paludigena TaxID=86838 RepID=A0AAV5GGZ4_9BASI|nr:hypothetical protein Rhopal_001603-T1 [Rhodotorula paludigena]